MNRKNMIPLLLAALLTWSCNREEPTPAPDPYPTPPGIVTLLDPADNDECFKGSFKTDSTSIVTFSWSKVENAQSYQLTVKNLITQQVDSFTTKEVTCNATLPVNMPYSWSVTSVNPKGETAGTAWKFYLTRTIISHVPFPAKLIYPTQGEVIDTNGATSVEVAFSWEGADEDNDIASYTLYLDTLDASTQVAESLTIPSNTRTVEAGNIYYWKVTTTDQKQNGSESIVGSFIVM